VLTLHIKSTRRIREQFFDSENIIAILRKTGLGLLNASKKCIAWKADATKSTKRSIREITKCLQNLARKT
jgi:hypothetical protein